MRTLVVLLILLLPVNLQAHSMKRTDQDIGVSTFFNKIDFTLENTSEHYMEYTVEVLDKDTFTSIPKKNNWAFNSPHETIKVAPSGTKKVTVKFKPSTKVRKYYVCTKAIATRDESISLNYTRVCLRLLLQPTARQQ